MGAHLGKEVSERIINFQIRYLERQLKLHDDPADKEDLEELCKLREEIRDSKDH